MRKGSLARERAPLRWSADSGDVEDYRPKGAARRRTAQHVTRRPRAPAPSDRRVDAAQQISHEGTPGAALASEWPRP
jgi:hypothetical protein